jgi:hypothetical protein
MSTEQMAAALAAAIVARADADAARAGEEHPAHWLASEAASERYKPKHAAVPTGTEPSC